MFWKPTVAVQADVASTLVELSKVCDDNNWDPSWVSTLQKRDQEKEEANLKVIEFKSFFLKCQLISSKCKDGSRGDGCAPEPVERVANSGDCLTG